MSSRSAASSSQRASPRRSSTRRCNGRGAEAGSDPRWSAEWRPEAGNLPRAHLGRQSGSPGQATRLTWAGKTAHLGGQNGSTGRSLTERWSEQGGTRRGADDKVGRLPRLGYRVGCLPTQGSGLPSRHGLARCRGEAAEAIFGLIACSLALVPASANAR
eukprot:356739-Chlamydomonas_euryale.AAC.3